MKVRILGQDNPNPTIINGASVSGIEGLLEKFLRHYRENPVLKHQPILLSFDDLEEKMIAQDPFYRGVDESEVAFKLRMLDSVTARVNEQHRFVGGFCATYVAETTEGLASSSGRVMGITYYEFPPYTTAQGKNHLPERVECAMLMNRIVPPNP